MDRTNLNRTLNENRDPKLHEIDWLARALGCSRDDLLEGVELPESIRNALGLRQDDARRNRERARMLQEQRGDPPPTGCWSLPRGSRRMRPVKNCKTSPSNTQD